MAVAYSFDSLASNSMKSKNPNSGCRQVEVAKTLDTTDPNPSKNQGGIAIVEAVPYTLKIRSGCEGEVRTNELVVEPVYCLQGNGIDRAETAGCNGKGWKEDASYTLNTIDRPAVAYTMQAFGEYKDCGVASSLKARDYKDATDIVCGIDCRNMNEYQELYPTLQAKPNGGQSLNFSGAVRVQYIVRRLTPLECCRLQGFPDSWGDTDVFPDWTDEDYHFWLNVRNTHAAINGKPVKEYTKKQMVTWYNKLHSDAAEYKMWGNGIALPCAVDVLSRLERN